MKLLPRILQILETLGKNLGKVLTKCANNMYDLARSCQELQEKYQSLPSEKRTKSDFSTKKPLRKNQEVPRILSRNPRQSQNLAKKSIRQIVVGYGFQPQTKFAAISNHNPYIEFRDSQLVEPF